MPTQTIYGRVALDGKILNGAGFKADRLGTGLYKITFTAQFQPPPVVVATQNNYPWFADQKTTDNVIVGNIKQDSCQIKTGDSSGGPSDREFSFIAMGPKAL